MGEYKKLGIYLETLKEYADELSKIRILDDSDSEERVMVSELCESLHSDLGIIDRVNATELIKLWAKNSKVLCDLLTDKDMVKLGLPAVTIMSYVRMLEGHIEELLDLFIKTYNLDS